MYLTLRKYTHKYCLILPLFHSAQWSSESSWNAFCILMFDWHVFQLCLSWRHKFFTCLGFVGFLRWVWRSFCGVFWRFLFGNVLSSCRHKRDWIWRFWVNSIDWFIVWDHHVTFWGSILLTMELGLLVIFFGRQGNFLPFKQAIYQYHNIWPF